MQSSPVPASPVSPVSLSNDSPKWFDWAVTQPCRSRWVEVEHCKIHYLSWITKSVQSKPGLLLVHGGGAHANWWRFVAPFFVEQFRVVALDLSGMGDSATRENYSASLRAQEMRAVIEDAELGPETFIVGHSFGGFMTMKFGVEFGDSIAGAIIADTPVRPPDDPPPGRANRIFSAVRTYPTYDEAVARFRLLPEQTCDNDFIVEFIARHSLRKVEDGWLWKFHPAAMGADRWNEPFHEHLKNAQCRTAYLFGEKSALVSPKQLEFIQGLMADNSPIVGIPEAAHHIMLDQPLAFISAVRAIIEAWRKQS